jgi:hypothetical protein
MQYIAKYISVPLPAIYTWNSDASNPVGAEYMIMQKVIYLLFSPSSSFLIRFKVVGCPALDVWDDLSLSTKEHVITQVTCHLMSIFELRFAHTGSLYQSSNGSYTVGPIMHAKYFKTIDGMPVYTDARVQHALHQFRGPFSDTADWLSSPMKAEIFALSSTPSPSPLCVGGHHHMIYHSL